MPALFEYPIRVTDADIDAQGHVSNIRYVEWMQAAAVAHSDEQGWSGSRYEEAHVAWVVRSHYVRYLRPAFADDRVVVRTGVASMNRLSSVRRFEFVREGDGEVLVRAETDWAFIDTDRQRPCRIPPEVGEAFELLPAHSIPAPANSPTERR